MNIILNTDQSYELTELAKATSNADTDLIYIVKQIDGKDVSIAITREQFIQGISGGGSDVAIQKNGTAVASQPNLNFIEGTNVTFDIVNDAANNRVNVTINASGGGSVAWGAITGTLADQTDLNTALGVLASGVSTNAGDISTNAANIGTNTSDIADNTDAIDDLEADLVAAEIDIADIQADYVKADADFDTAGRVVIVDSTGRKVVQGSKLLSDLRTEADVVGTTRAYTKGQQITEVALSISSSLVAVNLANSNAFTLNHSANCTISNPTGLIASSGSSWDILVTVTGAGGWTMALDTNYYWIDGGASPTFPNVTGDEYYLFMRTRSSGKTAVSLFPFQ